jgi:hypothetical protein
MASYRSIIGLAALADHFDVFYIDQFGVLHDGVRPYSGAIECLAKLKKLDKRVVLLSNSVKRAAANIARPRRSSGNLGVSARYVSRIYYTMTVWSDEESARAFVSLGVHRKAMSNFRTMGSGKTFGYRSSSLPQWEMAYSLWSRYGKDV